MSADQTAEYVALLGQRVVVTLNHGAPDGTGVVVAEGILLAFDDGGEIVLEDEMGFVHHCWPMLDIKPAHIDGTVCDA